MASKQPTRLERLLFEKGKSREWLSKESKVSYPVVLMTVQGFRRLKVKDESGKIIGTKRVKYEPNEYSLIRIAKCFRGVKWQEIYEDRSNHKD